MHLDMKEVVSVAWAPLMYCSGHRFGRVDLDKSFRAWRVPPFCQRCSVTEFGSNSLVCGRRQGH